jgi:FKBP-type peptidyl-prolyl cis-trans isomerase
MTKQSILSATLSATILGASVIATGAFVSCTKCSGDQAATTQQPATSAATPAASENVTELKIETLKPGNGAVAASGKKVTVHYTGKLTNGTVFDSSEQRQVPFPFVLGQGQVIQGWEKGVEGMKVGERRKLTIPPQMAYGDKAIGSVIPANSTLVFEVELLNVE